MDAVLPVPPALAGNARLAAAVADAGLTWVGPDAEVLERLGGDGVEPASERGFLAWVTAEGLHHVTPVLRDRAGGTARVSWTPSGGLGPLPAAARRLPELGWRGLVTVGIDPDGELAEVAAGFSLDMAVLERAHSVDAVELTLRSVAGEPAGGPARTRHPRARRSPSSCAPRSPRARRAGSTGRLPDVPARSGRRPLLGAEVVAVSGYDPGDRLDGWYDALLATVSAAAPSPRTRGRRRDRRARRPAGDRGAARRRGGQRRAAPDRRPAGARRLLTRRSPEELQVRPRRVL